jgi:hypothetical protein
MIEAWCCPVTCTDVRGQLLGVSLCSVPCPHPVPVADVQARQLPHAHQ